MSDRETERCPNCDGTGAIVESVERERNVGRRNTRVVGGKCARCGGTGEVTA